MLYQLQPSTANPTTVMRISSPAWCSKMTHSNYSNIPGIQRQDILMQPLLNSLVDLLWCQHQAEMPNINLNSSQVRYIRFHTLTHARGQEGILQGLHEQEWHSDSSFGVESKQRTALISFTNAPSRANGLTSLTEGGLLQLILKILAPVAVPVDYFLGAPVSHLCPIP